MSARSRRNKIAYDKKYHRTRSRKKYRAELNRKNRKAGTYGNGDGKDASHHKDGSIHMESQSTNRSRNGHNGKSRLK